MTKPETQIKNIIESHLRRALFGMNVWGTHEIETHDSITIIECQGPSRFETYGTATVYHPELGKWFANLKGQYLRGTPRQALTAEEIKTHLAERRSQLEALYRVYAVEMPPETPPVSWNPCWEKK